MLGSNVTRDVHWCVTVFYQQIENGNIANQIHGFPTDYGKFVLNKITPKSRAESRSKMPTNMASKFLKFVYRKCCVHRLRLQNIYRLNRRRYLSLLVLKEKCTRYVGVSTNEADLFDRHDHRAGQSKIVLPHIFAVLGVVCGADTKAKMWVRMWLPYKLSHLTSSCGARNDASKIENNKTQQPENTANNNQVLAAVVAHMQDARHPIHRVRIPYSKFSSPKSRRDVHKSSLKIRD